MQQSQQSYRPSLFFDVLCSAHFESYNTVFQCYYAIGLIPGMESKRSLEPI